MFHIKSSIVTAHAIVHSRKSVEVIAGSNIVPVCGKKFVEKNDKYYLLRRRLIESKIIKNGTFVSNYEFSSLSAAAAVILGRSTNGRIEWLNEDNVAYADLEQVEIRP